MNKSKEKAEDLERIISDLKHNSEILMNKLQDAENQKIIKKPVGPLKRSARLSRPTGVF